MTSFPESKTLSMDVVEGLSWPRTTVEVASFRILHPYILTVYIWKEMSGLDVDIIGTSSQRLGTIINY